MLSHLCSRDNTVEGTHVADSSALSPENCAAAAASPVGSSPTAAREDSLLQPKGFFSFSFS